MIVRILGEGQYAVADADGAVLDDLDASLLARGRRRGRSRLRRRPRRAHRRGRGRVAGHDSCADRTPSTHAPGPGGVPAVAGRPSLRGPTAAEYPAASGAGACRACGTVTRWAVMSRDHRHAVSTARNIPTDRGLTIRMFTTGLLLVLLYGAVIGLLIAFGVSWRWCWSSPRPSCSSSTGSPTRSPCSACTATSSPRSRRPSCTGPSTGSVRLADMKKPRVAIADTDVPNAFATGRSPNNAVVCATTGLMRRLDEPELEAVLAHELSHVAHRDVAVMTIASFLGMVAGMITRIMLWTGLLGGFGGRQPQQQPGRRTTPRWSSWWSWSSRWWSTPSASC